MLRGLSSMATRSRRKAVMRLATTLSREANSFLALSSNSISQAKITLHFVQRISRAASCANVDQALLGKV
jgi:hypothetical protein